MEEDLDECEIRIVEMGTLAARQFPRAFSVTSGGKPYAEIKLESADWGGK